MPRIELRDGQWAELRERITHGVDKDIKRARTKAMTEAEAEFDWTTVITRAFVREWNVKDPDGNPIPITDPDAIERAPDDIIDVLWPKAAEAWTGATQPNEPYSRLIGRLILGQSVGTAEIEALPDPETFRDALILATAGTWSPSDLDETDALLLALVRKIREAKTG
jgi:hypothetical protein